MQTNASDYFHHFLFFLSTKNLYNKYALISVGVNLCKQLNIYLYLFRQL